MKNLIIAVLSVTVSLSAFAAPSGPYYTMNMHGYQVTNASVVQAVTGRFDFLEANTQVLHGTVLYAATGHYGVIYIGTNAAYESNSWRVISWTEASNTFVRKGGDFAHGTIVVTGKLSDLNGSIEFTQLSTNFIEVNTRGAFESDEEWTRSKATLRGGRLTFSAESDSVGEKRDLFYLAVTNRGIGGMSMYGLDMWTQGYANPSTQSFIGNLSLPFLPRDAANKEYVDSKTAGGSVASWTNSNNERLVLSNASMYMYGKGWPFSLNNQAITRVMVNELSTTNKTVEGSDGYHTMLHGDYGDIYGGTNHYDYSHGVWWRFNDPTNGEYNVLWAVQRPEYSNYLHSTAIKMFHPLLMDTQNIMHVANPVNVLDAANKQYVDGIANAATGSYVAWYDATHTYFQITNASSTGTILGFGGSQLIGFKRAVSPSWMIDADWGQFWTPGYTNFCFVNSSAQLHPVGFGEPKHNSHGATKGYVDARTNICSTAHVAAGGWLGQTWYSNGASTKAAYYWSGTWQQVY